MSMLDTLRHFAMLVVSVQGCAGPAVEGGKATIRSPVLGCPGTGSKFLMVAASLPLYPGHRQCGVFLSPSPFADRQAHERSRALRRRCGPESASGRNKSQALSHPLTTCAVVPLMRSPSLMPQRSRKGRGRQSTAGNRLFWPEAGRGYTTGEWGPVSLGETA